MDGRAVGLPIEGGASEPGVSLVYEFGPFRLRTSDRSLFRARERVRVSPRVFDFLLCLVEDAGRVVSKDRLLERVWEGTFVEEGNVNRTVSTLRRILDETDESPYIETIPRQGYRFVAPVSKGPEAGEEPPAPPRGRASGEPAPELAEGAGVPADASPAGAPPRATRARVAAAGLLLLLFAGVAVAWSNQRKSRSAQTLAVLPFRFPAGAPNGETIGVALADAVIARLSRGEGVVVRPTTSILRYRDGRTGPLAAAAALGAGMVLDGHVEQRDGRTEVSIRLLRRSDGAVLLSETFRTGGADVFELQDRVAERVAAALLVELSPAGEPRAAAARAAATELFLRGRLLCDERSSSREVEEEAIGLFRRALESDAGFALGWTGLADALLASSEPSVTEAEEAARRALSIDDRLGPAHATLGVVRMRHDWRWQEAAEELERALALEPSYAPAWRWRAVLFALSGRLDEATSAAAHAVVLEPSSPAILSDSGRIALWAGRLDEARSFQARALSAAPLCGPAAGLGDAIRDEEDPEGARRRARERLAALRVDDETAVLPREEACDELALASAFARAGRKEPALAWLALAVRERRAEAPLAAVDPAFRSLRPDPRFAALVASMGLPARER